jgi:uncharacterized protein (TIGR02284 family)
MAVNREELISCLNDLIQTCRDSEKGFKTAAERVKSDVVSNYFERCSLERAQFASELQAEVRQLGGDPATMGSPSGVLHRGWMNVISAVTGDDAIVSECEREEDSAVKAYQEALKQNLPPNVLPVVKHQFTRIKQSHDRLRDMKKRAA